MLEDDLRGKSWKAIAVTYRAMGLTEEEIAKRLLCITERVIDGRMNLGERDKSLRKYERGEG